MSERLATRPEEPHWGAARLARRVFGTVPLVFFAALAVVAASTVRDYGLTWDEASGQSYGQQLANWYSSLGSDTLATHGEYVHFYGWLFEILAHAAQWNPPLAGLGRYEARHVVNVIFGLVGIFFTYKLGRLLGGGRGTGLVAAAFLTLTPVYYGHMFTNPKDIPFAAMYVWGVYEICALRRALPRPGWGAVLRTGLAIGLTLAVRIGGVFLFPVLGLAVAPSLLETWRRRGAPDASRPVLRIRDVIGVVLVVPALAWAVMCAFWPFGLVSPLRHPLDAIAAFGKYSWSGSLLFDGRLINSHAVPVSYIPTWLAVTMPDFLLLGAFLGLWGVISRWRRREPSPGWPDALLAVVAGVLPPALIALRHATIYDGIRHVLFCLPPLVAVIASACVSFVDGLKARWEKVAVAGAVGLAMVVTAADMVRLHPYEYVYFNRLIGGGLRGAAGRFDTDYWGSSFKEAMEWTMAQVEPNGSGPVRVGNACAAFLTAYSIERDAFRGCGFVNVSVDAVKRGDVDVVLAITRDGGDRRVSGRVLHRVERFGVPLCYVILVDGHESAVKLVEPEAPLSRVAGVADGLR